MLFTAKLKHLRISPRKVRLVANLIKGLTVKQAQIQLKFLTKRSSVPILKLLNSAVANAENDGKASKDDLFIQNVIVDAGPTLKRWRARAMGRASSIMKRTSHITLILDQKEGTVVEKPKKEISEQIKEKLTVGQDKDETLLEEIGKPIERVKGKEEKTDLKIKKIPPLKPYSTTSKSKKKFFSRQTFGNAKKMFRRKSF